MWFSLGTRSLRVLLAACALSLVLAPAHGRNDTADLVGHDPVRLHVLHNDAGSPSLSSVSMPANGTATVDGDVIVYTPNSGFEGEDQFTYTTTGAQGGSFTVQVSVTPQSLETEIERRLASEPAFRAEFVDNLRRDIRMLPNGMVANQLRAAINERLEQDPWFAQRFRAAFQAASTQQALDLYVLVGDDNLQGVTESGMFNGPGARFRELMGVHSSNAVVVLNCAAAGTTVVQWNHLVAPTHLAPPYLAGERRLDWLQQCLEFADGIVADANVAATVRGLVVSLGGHSALALQRGAPAALLARWQEELAELVSVFRATYGADLAVQLLAMPAPDENPAAGLRQAWNEIQAWQQGFRTYNYHLLDTQGIPTWADGSPVPLFSDAGQAMLAERLVEGFLNPQTPRLGDSGPCTDANPCFPGTGQRIVPGLCDRTEFFRRNGQSRRILCDQHGNSLHAMAAACGTCLDLEQLAAGQGVGLFSARTGPDFKATYYNRQTIGQAGLRPLPYDSPFTAGEPRSCGYLDRESEHAVLAAGDYDYVVESRLAEACQGNDRGGCGLLLDPGDSLVERYTRTVTVQAGSCVSVVVGEEAPEPEPPPPAVPYSAIQTRVFNPNCALSGCHSGPSPAQGMSLVAGVSHGNIVGVPSTQQPSLLRIDPGNPDSSYLIRKVEGTAAFGGRMPLGRSALPGDLIQLLRDWVADGAPGP